MSYEIVWEKYEEAIRRHLRNELVDEYVDILHQRSYRHDDDDDDDYGFGDDDFAFIGPQPMMMNPVPLSPHIQSAMSLCQTFDCWLGHTNFDIDKEFFEQVNKVPGVEGLKLFSRYRFLIGIGKAFQARSVMGQINQLIGEKNNDSADTTDETGATEGII